MWQSHININAEGLIIAIYLNAVDPELKYHRFFRYVQSTSLLRPTLIATGCLYDHRINRHLKSLTLVRVGPVIIESPIASKNP